jgi:RNA polymerase sigma-70 factor (ECF subfamily)
VPTVLPFPQHGAKPAPLERAGLVAAIVRQHNRRLFRVARSILKDDTEAEEVVQDTYVRAFTHLDALRDPVSLPGWLVRIAMNEALARLRRRRDTVPLDEIADLPAGAGIAAIRLPGLFGQPSPEDAAMQAELRRVLERAIDALPAHFRMVLVACDVEQMTPEDAAEALGLHAVTVRTRLFRARRQLRRALGAEFAAALPTAYPCAGPRCDRIVQAVLRRLAAQGFIDNQENTR